MKNKFLGILAGGFLATAAADVSAVPMVAIDLDTATAGIQSSVTLAPGAPSFAASVVAWDDGTGGAPPPVFFVSLDVTSSATGSAALGPVATSGSFAAGLPILVDVTTTLAHASGTPLTPMAPPSAGSLGGVGYADLFGTGVPFPVDAAVSPTGFIDLIHFTIMPGLTIGTSTLALPGLTLLTLVPGAGPTPVLVTGLSATVEIAEPGPMVMAEPATLALFGVGLLGLAGLRRRAG